MGGVGNERWERCEKERVNAGGSGLATLRRQGGPRWAGPRDWAGLASPWAIPFFCIFLLCFVIYFPFVFVFN